MIKNTRKLKGFVVAAGLFVSVCSFALPDKFNDDKKLPSLLNNVDAPVIKRVADSIYNLVGLDTYGLERDVFYKAYKGYEYLLNKGLLKKKNLLTVCDYSQSSNNKRLYVIDVENSRLLFNTYVSHGKNSGGQYATSFSNLENSNKSSLGFLITAETYSGVAGYSLRLNGMEPGINDHVRSRDIVLHGSKYVNESVISARGMVGNSYGCPAVPLSVHRKIIDAVKGGSCFYIYYPDNVYLQTSRILNSTFDLSPAAYANAASTAAATDASSTSSNSIIQNTGSTN